jgi:hypothetical protein
MRPNMDRRGSVRSQFSMTSNDRAPEDVLGNFVTNLWRVPRTWAVAHIVDRTYTAGKRDSGP